MEGIAYENKTIYRSITKNKHKIKEISNKKTQATKLRLRF